MNEISQVILNNLPWFWVAVTVICILIETFTMGLTTIWFAIGSAVMIFVSMTHIAFKWQLLLFVVISCALLFSTRPFALKKLQSKKIKTNSDSLIGKKAIVTEKIEPLQKGAIQINGIEWTAASANGTVIEKGSECEITDIQGATAIVK